MKRTHFALATILCFVGLSEVGCADATTNLGGSDSDSDADSDSDSDADTDSDTGPCVDPIAGAPTVTSGDQSFPIGTSTDT